jgi:predicted Zn-dependent protease
MADRIEQLHRMLAADPDDAFCLYALGMEYVARDEPARGVAHLEQSLRTDPDQPYAHFHLARCHASMGEQIKAEEAVSVGLEVAQRTGDANAASELASLREGWCD